MTRAGNWPACAGRACNTAPGRTMEAWKDGSVTGADTGGLGRVFNEVPELYDRTRPAYPDALFADLTVR